MKQQKRVLGIILLGVILLSLFTINLSLISAQDPPPNPGTSNPADPLDNEGIVMIRDFSPNNKRSNLCCQGKIKI